ncbi:MAG: DNA recombination protein RmuC [Pelagibacteraceae bacterium]|jgi:DNA recombination protein RmuC|nr:DNA recombination protein RmuC [Pelagibacteraceae bacterium]
MMEIIIYITCGAILAFILYSFLNKKKDKEDDASVLSTQLSELSRRFTVLEEAAKQMGSMQTSIDTTFKNFQNMLDDKQERGAFSEVELEKLLRDRLPANYLKFQETLSNGKRVDCLIDFGDANSRLGIDSKFVLDNFKVFKSSESEEEIKKYKKLFEEDVMKNVKKISSDYIIPGETAPHAIMFVRSESVYRSIQDSDVDLMGKAREKNVLIVSPSYLWGLLNTLRVFLKDSEMNKKAQMIIKEIGMIGKDIGRLVERTEDVEKKFNLVADQFRNIKVSAEKIQRRSEKIVEIEGTNIPSIEKEDK